MTWNQIHGNWQLLKRKAKQQWTRLSTDDLESVAGRRDYLAGMIQERYNLEHSEAEGQVSDWVRRDKHWYVRTNRDRV